MLNERKGIARRWSSVAAAHQGIKGGENIIKEDANWQHGYEFFVQIKLMQIKTDSPRFIPGTLSFCFLFLTTCTWLSNRFHRHSQAEMKNTYEERNKKNRRN